MLRTALIALALVAALFASGRLVFERGVASGRAEFKAELAAVQAAARAALDLAETQRLALQAERDRLARDLEEAALADPVLVPQCLGPDRVRRLNALR